MEEQSTIKSAVSLEGVGLHTGEKVTVTLKPALPNSGINFVRVDLPGKPVVNARVTNILDAARRPRRTSLAENGVEVHTIEHLMATLCALRLDNITAEIDRPELPGLDGSAREFYKVLLKAGIEKQGVPRRYFRLRESIWLRERNSVIMLLPDDKFRISYTLNYDQPALGSQFFDYVLDGDNFGREIAPSRTFCLQEEVEKLRSLGLGKGANYENTVVMGEKGVIKNKLRFHDEFARHKVLDLIGDLSLLQATPLVHVVALRSGHELTLNLLQQLRRREERIRNAGVEVAGQEVQPAGLLDAEQIQKILPHRYPFLFIDKILELEEDKRAVGIKNVTINDNFFVGHFPGHPIMPGVLVVEAMAQVAGVLMLNKSENLGKLAYFMSIDKVKFRKAVVPGDQLRLEVEVVKLRSRTGQVHTRALVEDKVVAEADLMFALVEPE